MSTNMTWFRCFSKILAFLCFGQMYPQHCKGYDNWMTVYGYLLDGIDPYDIGQGNLQAQMGCMFCL